MCVYVFVDLYVVHASTLQDVKRIICFVLVSVELHVQKRNGESQLIRHARMLVNMIPCHRVCSLKVPVHMHMYMLLTMCMRMYIMYACAYTYTPDMHASPPNTHRDANKCAHIP